MPDIALPIDAVQLDADLQSRARIDDETWKDYAEALAAEVQLPAITVYFDGAVHWLSDGFHRWHANKAIGAETILADVRQGSKLDALRFSLGANATHGKQRGQADYTKAYEIACRNGLVEDHDAEGLQGILQCSLRWARELTKAAREAAHRRRDEAIRAERAKGSSVRKTAEKVGVSPTAVTRAEGVPKRKAAVSEHLDRGSASHLATLPEAPQSAAACERKTAVREQGVQPQSPTELDAAPKRLPGLVAIEEPGVRRWALALEAMRAINDLPSVDEMFEHPDWRQHRAIEAELFRAAAWLNTFSTRFAHDRPAR